MARKPEVKFDNLYPKLYNTELWLMAYERIAPKPGNMTAGVDGTTVDSIGMERIEAVITDLKTSRYRPNPVRRVYIPKPNGKMRPIGVPSFEDKLLQTVVRLILEAIYEPTFSWQSHGFRPNRSCHTALEQVKKMRGVRWWVEGDIKEFFDSLHHDTLLRILGKRITDKRFLHLIEQFLKAGYVEGWRYNKTYSGTPQGGNLSPTLSNIYLNELDQMMARKIAEFKQGKSRQINPEYRRVQGRKKKAKRKAQKTGDWTRFRTLRQQLLNMECTDPLDPHFRRMEYIRYADDFLIGINGSKADAVAIKAWLKEYLNAELQLELSEDKTLITNAKERVRFLGYDIMRWHGVHTRRIHNAKYGAMMQRTTPYNLRLLIPRDKVYDFARTYGNPSQWDGKRRQLLLHRSELEILTIFNAEIRGFLNYYALADNLSALAANLLWMTTGSFLQTIASKRKSTLYKVMKSLKTGPATLVIRHTKPDGTVKAHTLIASTRQLKRRRVASASIDQKSSGWIYYTRTELGQRLSANQCEWCGTNEGLIEVHHVRRLKDLKGKADWKIQMIARRRKTMVLCQQCHRALHAGKLTEANRKRS